MPTFTNTELITGTHTSAAQKPVEPEDIAAAVIKVLDKPDHAGVGAAVGPVLRRDHAGDVGEAPSLAFAQDGQRHGLPRPSTPRRGRHTKQRAQHAQGVVEGPEKI